MKTSRFSEEQIAYALRAVERANRSAMCARQVGVSEATFYLWEEEFAASV